MRLVSFGPQGRERFGALVSRGLQIIDLAAADESLPVNIIEFLNNPNWSRVRDLISNVSELPANVIHPAGSVRLGAPIPRPGLIVAVGRNYKEHADEQGAKYPERPLLFSKAPGSASGSCDDIVYPAGVERLDYEVELAVVIGKSAKDVSADDAFKYVAGYCVLNDVSARCAQASDKQWFRAKSFDTFAPFGPALVTPDEVGDPQSLSLRCWVNGELRQDSNTSQMIFSLGAIIAHVTACMTLHPGDIIATGTPSGVGAFMEPPRLLNRGDLVEMEIDGLGRLSNRVV